MTDALLTPGTVAVPGAVLAFSVRGDLADATPDAPPLILCGSPMDSTGFVSLAAGIPAGSAGRVLVLTDPRNTGRSTRDDDTAAVTPEQHAEDLHALIGALGAGPVDVFASSGAAVNFLHLVAAHPDDVRLLVAHEPPMTGLLSDAAAIGRVCDDMVATYDASGFGPAMARFIGLVMHRGEVTGEEPAPNPAPCAAPRRASSSASARSPAVPTTVRSPAGRRTPWPARWAWSRSSSPAATTASSAASSASRQAGGVRPQAPRGARGLNDLTR